MTRRNFLNGLLTAAAGFTILPSAGRIWHVRRRLIQCGSLIRPYGFTARVTDEQFRELHRVIWPAFKTEDEWNFSLGTNGRCLKFFKENHIPFKVVDSAELWT